MSLFLRDFLCLCPFSNSESTRTRFDVVFEAVVIHNTVRKLWLLLRHQIGGVLTGVVPFLPNLVP
jgi:hypothetical protein